MFEWLRRQTIEFCISRMSPFWYYVICLIATEDDFARINSGLEFIALRRRWQSAQQKDRGGAQ